MATLSGTVQAARRSKSHNSGAWTVRSHVSVRW